MDIRNFFGKAGKPAKKPKKKDTSAAACNINADAADGASAARRTEADSDDSPLPVPQASKQEDNSKDSISTEKKEPREEKKRSPAPAVTPAAGTANKRSRTANERKEVSASDFFAQSSKPKPMPLKVNKKDDEQKKNEEFKGGDDFDDEIDVTKPAGDRKRGRRLAIESDDSDEDDNVSSKTFSSKSSPIADGAASVSKSPSPINTGPKTSPSPPVAKEEPVVEQAPTKATRTPKAKAPPKKRSTSSSKKAKKEPALQPGERISSFDTDSAISECLEGRTFVFTGVLENLARDAAQDFVKVLGGRVTTAVSTRTDYLVAGDLLEDGRQYTEGSKYKKASELGVYLVKGEQELYGLAKQYNDKALKDRPVPAEPVAAAAPAPVPPAAPAAAAPPNPYVAKRPSNPYARASNPYAKPASKPSGAVSTSFNPYDTKTAAKSEEPKVAAAKSDPTSLWADRYAPQTTRDILGNQDAVKKLQSWLGSWEARFNNPKARGKIFSSPNGPWKAALLSGSPGIGKTTMATLVAKEAGRDLLEFNASDVRSKKALGQGLGDVTGSRVLFDTSDGSGKKGSMKKRCIIMDEVDGMGAGDRSGMAELIKMIKTSQVPIICICNDRQSQKIRSLVQYCMDLRCRRPIKSVIARRAVQIGKEEGLFVEQNAAEAIVESCGNDIRQVLNVMQMWANKKGAGSSMTYKDLKEREHSINKDEILRVSMFDATKMIIEGRKGLTGTDPKAERASIMKRSDAFFVDYSLMGLNVQQNYLKVLNGRYGEAKRSGDERKVESFLVEMHKAADAMSDFAVAENAVRSGDQNWALLPLCAMLAVKTGYHASGENGAFFPGFPEFPAWMGKNSTRGKKNRLLAELGHHMNYHIGGDSTELRMCYIPVLRERFLSLLTSKDGAHTAEAIALMDEYGLDRDDVFENLDEFKLNPKAEKLGSVLDSKQKAAFTREYNQGKHKSQALVAEQGLVKTKKAKSNGGSNAGDLVDPDAINDDVVEVSGDENEKDDLEEAKIREKFLKKKGKSTAAKKKKASTGDKGKKKK